MGDVVAVAVSVGALLVSFGILRRGWWRRGRRQLRGAVLADLERADVVTDRPDKLRRLVGQCVVGIETRRVRCCWWKPWRWEWRVVFSLRPMYGPPEIAKAAEVVAQVEEAKRAAVESFWRGAWWPGRN